MRVLRLVLYFSIVVVLAGRLFAQGGAFGTILGTVTDNAGAVIPNAGVDVTNLGTNVTKHTVTTSTGNFTVPYLDPGIYRVTVEAPNFQKVIVDRITLVVGQVARADAALKPGAVTETI